MVVYASPSFPPGNELVVICGGNPVTFNASACVSLRFALSTTRIVKLNRPATVGVPEITPLDSCTPFGKLPLNSDHVSGAVPFTAVKVLVYGWPTAPGARLVVVILGGAVLTVMVSDWVSCSPLASTTRTVKFHTPDDDGVPEITPLARDNPEGNAPEEILHV